MSEAIDYTAHELLSDGSRIEIRALQREDEADMLAAVGKTSAQSLQRRFFVMKRHFSDKERSSAAAGTLFSSRGGRRWHLSSSIHGRAAASGRS